MSFAIIETSSMQDVFLFFCRFGGLNSRLIIDELEFTLSCKNLTYFHLCDKRVTCINVKMSKQNKLRKELEAFPNPTLLQIK